VALGDWGYAVVLEQAVLWEDGESTGYRGFVTGLHVYLTAEHGGLPAGSELLIGYAEAAARAPAPPPAPPQEQEPAGGSGGGSSSGGGQSGGAGGGSQGGGSQGPAQLPSEPTTSPPGADPGPPPIVLDPPANVQPQITGQGYVFPVYGPASFTDDFNAARANTGWHHGNDIFAPLGAPVLAVADGTLFSVGWNNVGGHRLWLRDRQGNEYYYAHLSAYSPLAFNGARVRAGDVIGFVGDSGDAAGTPYHLHFEIHPRALLGLGYDGVVNPYRYLLAWYGRQDLSEAQTVAGETVLQPPAVIIQAEDIAAVSGLEPEGLVRAYELPLLIGSAAALVAPERPTLVGAEPGFAGL
jgi:murein DD-endopeptidase MepM/ murein hydrolase activator NlpD